MVLVDASGKKSLRQSVLAERKILKSTFVRTASRKVYENVKSLHIWGSQQNVHIYLPIKNKKEVDSWPLVAWLLENDHEVWASYLAEDKSQDGFCKLNKNTKYERGRYNIPLPQETVVPTVETTAIIVPCLAADKSGNRLGYGSGWYDWFLSKHPDSLKIGLAYNQFLLDNIPHNDKDEPLNIVVSEDGIIHTGRR